MKKRQPLKVLITGVILASGLFVSNPMDFGVQAAWESQYNIVPDSEKGTVKTVEEIKKLTIDLFNKSEYQPEDVVVRANKNFEKQIDDYFNDEGYRQDIPGYSYYGRSVQVWVEDASFWVKGVKKEFYEYTIEVVNERDEEDEISHQKKLDAAEKYIVDNYKLNTDYDVVFAINDFIADNFSYGMILHDIDHPYFTYLQGGFTCGPYTQYATELYKRFGIKSREMTGGAYWSGEAHAWNAVYVGGQWYYSDATAYDSTEKEMMNILMTEDVGYVHWGINLNTNTEYEITKFRASDKKFEQSMSKPYSYEAVKKAQAPKNNTKPSSKK